ncbi:MAG TPA: peptidylprolyl isomerase [Dehalococcoidia bacterium]|nr:peptidylprolyl isomerase [Dehalococcoidia bacterium]
MSFSNSPNPRRVRRERGRPVGHRVNPTEFDLPGPLRYLGNRKLFLVMGLIFAGAIVGSLLYGMIGLGSSATNTDNPPGMTGNEAPDVPLAATGTAEPGATAAPVKRYTAAPELTIDTTKKYLATIKTSKGEIKIELYPDQAPQAVNSFIFLANDGYYTGTPFMQLAKNQDGSKFYAQAGDPTRTGYGTPGYTIKKENTTLPFSKGAVGMGGSAENSNGGQFFISFGDYPALNGKYTIFGKVVSGLDVLNNLSLLDLTKASSDASGDEIQSITIAQE